MLLYLFFLVAFLSANPLDSLLENGYPFASSHFTGDSLILEQGPLFLEGGVRHNGLPQLKDQTLNLMTGIKLYSPWSLGQFQAIERRIQNLGYYSIKQKPELFKDKRKRILYTFLTLEENKTSRIEGFLSAGEDSPLQGSLVLDLQNLRYTARDFFLQIFEFPHRKSYRMSYKEPWIFDAFWDLLTEGEYSQDSLKTEKRVEIGIQRSKSENFRPGLFWGWLERSDSLRQVQIQYSKLTLDNRLQNSNLNWKSSFLFTAYWVENLWEPQIQIQQSLRWLFPLIHIAPHLEYRDLLNQKPQIPQFSTLPFGGIYGLKAYPTASFYTEGDLRGELKLLYPFNPAFLVGVFAESAFFKEMGQRPKILYDYGLCIETKHPNGAWQLAIDYATKPNRDWRKGFVNLSITHYF